MIGGSGFPEEDRFPQLSPGVTSTGLHVCGHVIMYESPVVCRGFRLLHPERIVLSFKFVHGLLSLAGSSREVETRGKAKNVSNQ